MPETPAYKRILLKLSGEALMGDDNYGINRLTIERIVAVAATSFAASRRLRPTWTARPPTTWACSQR
jgi:hypothetical protein